MQLILNINTTLAILIIRPIYPKYLTQLRARIKGIQKYSFTDKSNRTDDIHFYNTIIS